MKLLYRAKRDGFTGTKFHELCNGKGATLTICKSKNYEHLFGGYADIPWESSNRWCES